MEIIVPDHTKIQTEEPDWAGVPLSYVGKMSAVCRSLKDCQDLVQWYANEPLFCPDDPVLLLIPGVWPPVVVAGMGFATTAELRDAAVEAWGSKSQKIASGKPLMDFDDMRERAGLISRDKVAEAIWYAYADRIARHKASPVTDPFKQFSYKTADLWAGGKNRKVFPINGLRKS